MISFIIRNVFRMMDEQQRFSFQTLHPDTIMDALFEQGIRVDSGLTRLTAMKTVSINFRTKSVDVLSSNFIALNVGQPIKSSKNINLRCSW